MHLALDQSTSSTRALAFAEDGRILAATARPHAQITPRPGWVEHDAAEIWDNTRAVLAELRDRLPNGWQGADSLSLANQRETLVVWDRRTGAPAAPALVWQDRRGDPLCAEWRAAGRGPTVRARTGLPINGYFTASKLAWLLRERPELRAGLRARRLAAGTVDAYLVHRLTGGAVLAGDATNASRTLLYDVRHLRWDPELCAWAGLEPADLPEVRPSDASFGVCAADPLPPGLPLRGVMGDSQASLFAHGCRAPGEAKVTLGTGASLLLQIGPEFRLAEGAATALAWVEEGRPHYALEGLVNYAAATLTWFAERLGLWHDARHAEELAGQVADTGGVHIVPAFGGLQAPYDRPDARGAVVGLSAHTRPAHLARAAYEAVAHQVADIGEMLRDASGGGLTALRADGGLCRSELLLGLLADFLQRPVCPAAQPDLSAWGAVLMGRRGLGRPHPPAPAGSPVRPRRSPEAVRPDRAAWRQAVARVLL